VEQAGATTTSSGGGSTPPADRNSGGQRPGRQEPAPINDGLWHHVAFTRNQTTGQIRTYVDGALNATATGDSVFKSTPFFDIGSIGDTGGTPTFFTARWISCGFTRGAERCGGGGLANQVETTPAAPGRGRSSGRSRSRRRT
jgi:hypothetical protein